MNSHGYNHSTHHGKGWCRLDICFIRGQRNLVWGWVWKPLQGSRERAVHSSAPAMELHLRRAGHLQLPAQVPGPCQGAALLSDPSFRGPSLPRPGRALQRSAGPLSGGSCATAFSVLLVPLGSGAEQPCTGTKHSFAGIAAITPGSASPV